MIKFILRWFAERRRIRALNKRIEEIRKQDPFIYD